MSMMINSNDIVKNALRRISGAYEVIAAGCRTEGDRDGAVAAEAQADMALQLSSDLKLDERHKCSLISRSVEAALCEAFSEAVAAPLEFRRFLQSLAPEPGARAGDVDIHVYLEKSIQSVPAVANLLPWLNRGARCNAILLDQAIARMDVFFPCEAPFTELMRIATRINQFSRLLPRLGEQQSLGTE